MYRSGIELRRGLVTGLDGDPGLEPEQRAAATRESRERNHIEVGITGRMRASSNGKRPLKQRYTTRVTAGTCLPAVKPSIEQVSFSERGGRVGRVDNSVLTKKRAWPR